MEILFKLAYYLLHREPYCSARAGWASQIIYEPSQKSLIEWLSGLRKSHAHADKRKDRVAIYGLLSLVKFVIKPQILNRQNCIQFHSRIQVIYLKQQNENFMIVR